ncbi:MAG: GIY-YIG nuclease family protein [Candidatus Solibacter sp.]
MESKAERRDAARQFKTRKVAAGAYAVRCTATGMVWVGVSRNLDAARNSAWFSLRMDGHRVPSLQQAWNAQGEDAFQFEVLDTLDEDTHPMAVADLLKERKLAWVARLNAAPLL